MVVSLNMCNYLQVAKNIFLIKINENIKYCFVKNLYII